MTNAITSPRKSALAGRYLVLTPGQEQIGVSRKVEDPEERARLKELLAGIEPGEDMGVIIRTASEGAASRRIFSTSNGCGRISGKRA